MVIYLFGYQKSIVTNNAMKQHPYYHDVVQHELSHLILEHTFDWRYRFLRSARLKIEKEANKGAVKLFGANLTNLYHFLSEYQYRDKSVIKVRKKALMEILDFGNGNVVSGQIL